MNSFAANIISAEVKIAAATRDCRCSVIIGTLKALCQFKG